MQYVERCKSAAANRSWRKHWTHEILRCQTLKSHLWNYWGVCTCLADATRIVR